MKPTIDNLVGLLVGRTAKANHPITVLNPTETFVITEAKFEYGKVWVRSDETCWFGESMVDLV